MAPSTAGYERRYTVQEKNTAISYLPLHLQDQAHQSDYQRGSHSGGTKVCLKPTLQS